MLQFLFATIDNKSHNDTRENSVFALDNIGFIFLAY